MWSISHHITPVVINSLGRTHTHAYRRSRIEAILRNQVCAWFKNVGPHNLCKLQQKNLDKYITYLNDNCKLCFHMYVDKQFKVGRLDRSREVKAIKISEEFQNLKEAQKVQQLWEQWERFKNLKYFGITKGQMN